LSKVLIKRGLYDTEQIMSFLKPTVKNLNDPFLLPDMDKAVSRIIEARDKREKVIIYGDYDADGVTATSILFGFLSSIGVDVSYYIPDRVDEGYGISETAADYLSNGSFGLMLTVDCGISSKERIDSIVEKLAEKNRKMDFIITDHHLPVPGKIPEAYAVINPNLENSLYPIKHLCGAGISFKIVQALCEKLNMGNRYFDYVDLAALGTVADVVSITEENRIIVWAGIEKMKRCPNPGILALMDVSGMKDVDSRKLAFILAPRLNAAGRMGDAARAVRLLTEKDKLLLEKLAKELNEENAIRQKIQEEIYEKAIKAIESDSGYSSEKVLVVQGEDWHHGVIGIVASMLVERYYKPCFVISVSGDIAKGSARSIDGFNIYSAMEYCADLFIKYGGHKQAGGITMRACGINEFRRRINEYAGGTDLSMIPTINIDAEAEPGEINLEAAKAIMALAPFGEGNEPPLFSIKSVTVLNKKRIGDNGEHLTLSLCSNGFKYKAICFGMGELEPCICLYKDIDLVFSIGIDKFMKKAEFRLFVKAIRTAEKSLLMNRIFVKAAEKVACLDHKCDWIYNVINNHKVNRDDIRLSREDLKSLYRFLCKSGARTFTDGELFNLAEELSRSKIKMNYFKLLAGMIVLDQLGIICFSCLTGGEYGVRILKSTKKASLEDSALYSYLMSLQQAVDE
ncbi:MAG TPA: single-stranded-DNA-specific exonuclease RecJ, partial [Clostridia bacterium]